ncbi:MAG: WD40 repeat domain-containing protein [Flavobacteriales bacterium]|nr:WD40 repeat domain-containing protein [Flavobacteriales bacterium]
MYSSRVLNIEVKKRGILSGHAQPVYALEKIPDSSFVLSAGGDRWIALWDLDSMQSVKALAQATSTVYALCFIPEFNFLAIGEASGGLHILDIKASKPLKFFTIHQHAIFKLLYHPIRHWLYASSANGEISVWDIENLTLLHIIKPSTEKIRGLALNSENNQLAVACSDSNICIFSDELTLLHKFPAHSWATNTVIWHSSGDLISASRDAHIRRWKIESNSEHLIQNIPAHNYAIYSLVFSPDQYFMASASRDKTIKIWDANELQFLYRINKEKNQGHTHSVNQIIWHPWNNLLISCSDDKQIMIWHIEAVRN